MTAISTRGSKLSFAIQTDFNTPNISGQKDVRLEGDPTIETPTGVGVDPEFVGANPHQVEKPIVENQASDAAVGCTTLIRQAAVAGNDSFIASSFESGGYSVVSSDSTTSVGAATDTISVVSAGTFDVGYGMNVELADGKFAPTLIGFWDDGFQFTPVMELPSATPVADGKVNKAFTITPANLAQIANDKLITFVAGNKSGTIQSQDCALTSIGDLVFNSNEKLMLEFTFGASDKTRGDTPMTGSNDFADATGSKIVHCPTFQFANSSTDYTTALADARNNIISATITFNVTAEQVVGFGGDCVNNIQSWMQVAEPAIISVDMLYDSTKLSDFDDINASKYISISQYGTSASDPSVGFFMPNAHQMEAAVCDYYGNGEHRVTVKYVANPAEMDGTTSSDQGNQPWYLVIGDQS